MEGTGWLCVHCGTPNPDGGDVCGNCGLNPFKLEPGELLDIDPKIFRKFLNGKLKAKEPKTTENQQQ